VPSAPDPSTFAPIPPGTILAGKYLVERTLGQGGMGVVVQARHVALDERVALKFLLPAYAQQPEAAGRFLREARAAVKIKSEHVARVSDVGTLDGGAPYMVMEYLEGRDLARVLEQEGVLSPLDAIDFVIQACEAIAEAHSYGIIHRDIKPSNLFLAKRPDGTPIVKVLDFGISKMPGEGIDKLTKTNSTIGSALYMSPEQMRAAISVDHRTDVYALGISTYELLAGRQPFLANTLPELCAAVLTGTPTPLGEMRRDLPPALITVIERAYARDRAERFQSVADFVVSLAPFAPPRSQATIERVARLGGVPIPPLVTASGVYAAVTPPAPPATPVSPGDTRRSAVATPTPPASTAGSSGDKAVVLALVTASVLAVGGIGVALGVRRMGARGFPVASASAAPSAAMASASAAPSSEAPSATSPPPAASTATADPPAADPVPAPDAGAIASAAPVAKHPRNVPVPHLPPPVIREPVPPRTPELYGGRK
jgi:serine/threonine-protein kinase